MVQHQDLQEKRCDRWKNQMWW